ncbi:MAG: hypothetical protein AAF291_12940 [Pseudomonadota bacterium]
MSHETLSQEQVRGLIYKALGRWRTEELSFIRRRLTDIEDKLDALDNRDLRPNPKKAELRASLEENAAQWVERRDARIAMIEDAYNQMIDYMDRREDEGG